VDTMPQASYKLGLEDVDRVPVYRLEGERRFGRARELSAEHGDALETPLLPGFAVALADLFTDPLLEPRR
jgi:hypothetical protein